MKISPSIVFFGTPHIAEEILDILCSKGYTPSLVVTAPDKGVGRGYALTAPPVKNMALRYDIPILQPEKLDEHFVEQLTGHAWDLFIVAAYGKIIPQRILSIPAKGTLNVHGSLLPKYRGASPIQSAILNGESETGPTIMLLDEKMDHGPIVAQRAFPIAPEETSATLLEKMAKVGGELLAETIPDWIEGTIIATEQAHEKATYTELIEKEDGHIQWNQDALSIERMVRAYDPWPGTFSFWGERRIKILAANVGESRNAATPGTVIEYGDGIAVTTADAPLIITSLQLEGRKPQSGEEFARAYPGIIGTVLQ